MHTAHARYIQIAACKMWVTRPCMYCI